MRDNSSGGFTGGHFPGSYPIQHRRNNCVDALNPATLQYRRNITSVRKRSGKRLTRVTRGKERSTAENKLKPTFSIPGLENVLHSSNNCQRLVWLSSIIVFYGLCLYQLADRIALYLQAPVALDVHIEKIMSVEFPSIVVCPPYQRQAYGIKLYQLAQRNISLHQPLYYKDLNVTDQEIWKELLKTEGFSILHRGSCAKIHERLHDQHEAILLVNHTDHQKRNHSDHQKSTNKGPTNRDKYAFQVSDCSVVSMASKAFPSIWGTCTQLIPETNMNYRGAWTFTEVITKTHGPKGFSNLGVLKHQIVYIPYVERMRATPELAKLFYRVNRGEEASVSFTIQQYVNLNTKKSPCIDQETSTLCKEECLKERLNKTLECKLPFMENSAEQPCISVAQSHHALHMTENVYREFDDCNCPRACKETILTYTSDYHAYTHHHYAGFKIAFPDNAVEVITERFSYDFPSLLSDIGGNLGFCVGLCLFSFVEIGMSAFYLVLRGIHNKAKIINVSNAKI